jgi:hypothetical protein
MAVWQGDFLWTELDQDGSLDRKQRGAADRH